MTLFAAVISVIAMFLHFPANAGGRFLYLGACKLHQQITLISTFRAKHHCVNSMYTKNSSQTRINTFLRHFAPPRGLNFSDPQSPEISASTPPSPAKRGLSPRLHCLQHGRRSAIVRVVYAQCSMSVSIQGLVSLGHQDAGGALLGFWEPGCRGCDVLHC